MFNDIKETQTRKMNLLEKFVEMPQQNSELELFFLSICKTVEKFTPLQQAKIKMSILEIVNKAEILNIQGCTESIVYVVENPVFNSTAIESEIANNVFESNEQENDEDHFDLR